jgi:hypothetical protein
MAWTCPHCNEKVEEPATGRIRFCLHCGEPSESASGESTEETVSAEVAAPPDRLDGMMRLMLCICGAVWLVFFFLPFGRASYGLVMPWDLLADREGMAYLVAWPLMLALLFFVLGAVTPLPGWLRAGASVILGTAFLVVLGAEEPGGPLGPEIRFALMGGVSWLLLFPLTGAGLLLRSRKPDSVVARVLIGLGLLLGLIAYLSGAEGESTLVGALLGSLADDTAAQAITRIGMLCPMFLLVASAVGLRGPGEQDPARGWARALGWVWMVYLPAFLLLFGLMASVAGDSGYFFLLFLRLALYLGGIIVLAAIGSMWLAAWLPGPVKALMKRYS